MSLVAGTTYYTKVITVDKQGNQSISSQTAIAADYVHQTDLDLIITSAFRYHNNAGITLPAGASGSQVLTYGTQDYLSGNGSYAAGVWTAGAACVMYFAGNCEITGLALPNTSTMRLAIMHNGAAYVLGPNAAVLDDANTGTTSAAISCSVGASLIVAATDTVSLEIVWQGLTGKTIAATVNNYFEGHCIPT
jgi:hypothetical protein